MISNKEKQTRKAIFERSDQFRIINNLEHFEIKELIQTEFYSLSRTLDMASKDKCDSALDQFAYILKRKFKYLSIKDVLNMLEFGSYFDYSKIYRFTAFELVGWLKEYLFYARTIYEKMEREKPMLTAREVINFLSGENLDRINIFERVGIKINPNPIKKKSRFQRISQVINKT